MFHAATGTCVLIGFVAQPCFFFCSGPLVDSAPDSMNSEVLVVSPVLKIREDTNNLLGTTPIVRLRSDVCWSQPGAHRGQRDYHVIRSVAMWRTLGISTIICAKLWFIRRQLGGSLPAQLPCSKVNLLLLVSPLLRSRCI